MFNWKCNHFAPWDLLGRSQYQVILEQQYLENGRSKHYFPQHLSESMFDKLITGLVQTLDKQISRQHLRIGSIFPESKLKMMFFPDRLAKKNMIFQT